VTGRRPLQVIAAIRQMPAVPSRRPVPARLQPTTRSSITCHARSGPLDALTHWCQRRWRFSGDAKARRPGKPTPSTAGQTKSGVARLPQAAWRTLMLSRQQSSRSCLMGWRSFREACNPAHVSTVCHSVAF